MRSFRLWFGIGARRLGVTVLFYPLRWGWCLSPGAPTGLREIYLGPVVLQFWRPT